MERLKTLLRCLGTGDTLIFETPKGDYIAHQCKGTSLVPKGSVERTIESRIQFELYGEYPLSKDNKRDYEKIRLAFKLPRVEEKLELIKNHSL